MRENISNSALTETTMLVLLALYDRQHGYGVRNWISKHTQGRVLLGMGTLYGAINTLVKKKWIMEHSKDERRVYYVITAVGKKMVSNEHMRLKKLLELSNGIIGGNNV